MEMDRTPQDEAKKKILAFFSATTKQKLAEKDGHPAMRVVMTKSGPKLKTYIAQGARKTTGMHAIKQGHIQVVMGDMVKPNDAYYSEASSRGGKITSRSDDSVRRDLNYYLASPPRDVVGTLADIRKWFDDHADYMMVIAQSESVDDDPGDVAKDYLGTSTFTAEVRLLSWAKKGDKGYVDLGGMGTAVVTAIKQVAGLATGAIGNLSGESLSHTAAEIGHGTAHSVEIAEHLRGKEKAGSAGEFTWSRGMAEQFLEFAVSLHEGERIHPGKFTSGHTWKPSERHIVTDHRKQVTWPAISLGRVGARVVDELIPAVLDDLEAAAE